MKSPYEVIKTRHVTEKATVLEGLKHSASNKCTARCEKPKYVFVVDRDANKTEIKRAVEEIYSEKKIQVMCVNTVNTKPKPKRVRGRIGKKAGYKKAIVTLRVGDSIDEV
ncbi:MAG: 50S ribosomal protein L23 [Chlamydiae bacterium]|nr:50S ribosomal protein L23 [Chlamydiota bacterium]